MQGPFRRRHDLSGLFNEQIKKKNFFSRLRAFLSQIFLHSSAPMLADTIRGFRTVYNFVRLLLTTNQFCFYFALLCFALFFFIIFCFPCKQGLSENFVISQLGRALLNRIFGPGFLVHIILRKIGKNYRKKKTEMNPSLSS